MIDVGGLACVDAGEDVSAAAADLQSEHAVIADWDQSRVKSVIRSELEFGPGPGGSELDLQLFRLGNLQFRAVCIGKGTKRRKKHTREKNAQRKKSIEKFLLFHSILHVRNQYKRQNNQQITAIDSAGEL